MSTFSCPPLHLYWSLGLDTSTSIHTDPHSHRHLSLLSTAAAIYICVSTFTSLPLRLYLDLYTPTSLPTSLPLYLYLSTFTSLHPSSTFTSIHRQFDIVAGISIHFGISLPMDLSTAHISTTTSLHLLLSTSSPPIELFTDLPKHLYLYISTSTSLPSAVHPDISTVLYLALHLYVRYQMNRY